MAQKAAMRAPVVDAKGLPQAVEDLWGVILPLVRPRLSTCTARKAMGHAAFRQGGQIAATVTAPECSPLRPLST